MNNFEDLGLGPNVIKVLPVLGYEVPTPIQEKSIPILLQNQDLLAQAQTGTGKTAAFALPILSNLNLDLNQPQALVLTPTRELAIQVAEAFHDYAKFCEGFHVLPIYGGQDFSPQLRALKRGVHVIVGTPGRVMDHLRRGSLVLEHIKTMVLDEADEMLKMGFIDDVKWILEQIPGPHQTALFSATMPTSVRQIADRYLKQATFLQMKATETSVKNIEQFYATVSRDNKLETLTRFLEMEEFTAAIIFTRTKITSTELAEKLEARGHAAAAINGDMTQNLREKVIQKLKQGTIDIIVATEVAARGLDIDRISYVISYDIPYDVDSYIHRIGRTGRAGRTGKALVFVTPREQRMIKEIQHVTKQTIKELKPPSYIQTEEKRLQKFAEKISQVILQEDIGYYREFVKNVVAAGELNEIDIAAAVTFIAQNKVKPDQKFSAAPLLNSPRKRGEEGSGHPRKREEGYSDSRKRGEGGSAYPRKRGEGQYAASERTGDRSRSASRDTKRPFSRSTPPDRTGERSRTNSRDGQRSFARSGSSERSGASRDGQRSFSRPASSEKSGDRSRSTSRDGQRPFSRSAPPERRNDHSISSRDGQRPFSRSAPTKDRAEHTSTARAGQRIFVRSGSKDAAGNRSRPEGRLKKSKDFKPRGKPKHKRT